MPGWPSGGEERTTTVRPGGGRRPSGKKPRRYRRRPYRLPEGERKTMSHRSGRRLSRALRLLIGLALLLPLAACGKALNSVPEIVVVAASATMNEPAPVL